MANGELVDVFFYSTGWLYCIYAWWRLYTTDWMKVCIIVRVTNINRNRTVGVVTEVAGTFAAKLKLMSGIQTPSESVHND